MRVRKLHVRAAPGLPDGLGEIKFAPGLNLVIGPNAAGKSTLSRTIRSMALSRRGNDGVLAEARWTVGEQDRSVQLAYLTVTWEPEPPDVPGEEHASRYALDLRDLLHEGQADRGLARQLGIELNGGYDVDAARDSFPSVSYQVPSSLYAERERARATLRKAEGATEEVAAQERRLAQLRLDLTAAKRAGRLLTHAERAREIARERAAVVGLDAEAAGLPSGLNELVGTERDRLEELERDLTAARREREDNETQAAIQRAVVDGDAFPGQRPEEAACAAWRRAADELAEIHAAQQQAETELLQARAAETTSRAAVLAPDAAPPELAPGALDELEGLLDRWRGTRADLRAREQVVGEWTALEDTDADRVAPAALRSAVEALRRWLATPPPAESDAPTSAPSSWKSWILVISGVLVALVGVLLPPLLALGGMLFGAGLVLLLTRRRRSSGIDDRRAVFAEELRGSDLEPDRWDTETVLARLRELEQKLQAATEQQLIRRRKAAAQGEAKRGGEALEELEKNLTGCVAALGLAPTLVPLSLAHQARALDHWLAARETLARATECERAAQAKVKSLRSDMDAWLTGLNVTPEPADISRRAALDAIIERHRRLADAEERAAEANWRGAKAAERIRALEGDIEAIWRRAGVDPGDLAALDVKLEALGRRRRLNADRKALDSHIGKLAAELREAIGDGSLDVADPTKLEVEEADALVVRLQEEADGRDRIAEEVATIESTLANALGGTTLEDARTAVAVAENRLRQTRLQRARALLARLVIDDARQAQRDAHAPPILARARTWFAGFTGHGWRLEVDPRDQGRFCAFDTRLDERRELEQLSDATRIQLLLAARLAAIEALEGTDGPLPVCLDEILSTSDPTRFAEIARALLALTDVGRQVIYFTADVSEAGRWRKVCEDLGRDRPHEVDLGGWPRDGGAWGQDLSIAPPPAPVIPAPDGMGVDDYARTLGVPQPDGFRAAGNWHLIHVLSDDLDALHACLQQRIDAIGPWTDARTRGAPGGLPVGETTAQQVDARIRILETVLDGWRVGRGRPATWEDIQGSGAISDQYVDQVRDLLQTHARDSEGLVGAIAGLPYFRSAKVEALREYLEATGVIDERDQLPPADQIGRALGAVKDDLAAGTIDRSDAIAYAERVISLIGSALPGEN